MNLPRNLKKALLKRALKRLAPSRVPRSGAEGEAINCFTIRAKLEPEKSVIVQSLKNDQVVCLEHDGNRYSIETICSLDSVLEASVEITHYYGLATITYFSWFDFGLGQILCMPYLRVWWHFRSSDFDQYLFNKKQLVTKQRIDILRTVLAAQLNTGGAPSSLDVMTHLYSIKWFLHPNHEEHHSRIELYLQALSETGELQKTGITYSITGMGIAAIEAHEEQRRQHTESIATQRRMVWLTIVIATLAILQAGLVKLPPLIDLNPELQHEIPAKPKCSETTS